MTTPPASSAPGLDPAVLARLAGLAKLLLEPEEEERLARDLASILRYMEILDEMPLEEAAPLTHPLRAEAPLADDVPGSSLTADESLREAAVVQDGHFAVPAVVELTFKDGSGPGGRSGEGGPA